MGAGLTSGEIQEYVSSEMRLSNTF